MRIVPHDYAVTKATLHRHNNATQKCMTKKEHNVIQLHKEGVASQTQSANAQLCIATEAVCSKQHHLAPTMQGYNQL